MAECQVLGSERYSYCWRMMGQYVVNEAAGPSSEDGRKDNEEGSHKDLLR